MKWFRQLRCLHYWQEGGLTNFLSGAHEYRCVKCGKCIERTYHPINPAA